MMLLLSPSVQAARAETAIGLPAGAGLKQSAWSYRGRNNHHIISCSPTALPCRSTAGAACAAHTAGSRTCALSSRAAQQYATTAGCCRAAMPVWAQFALLCAKPTDTQLASCHSKGRTMLCHSWPNAELFVASACHQMLLPYPAMTHNTLPAVPAAGYEPSSDGDSVRCKPGCAKGAGAFRCEPCSGQRYQPNPRSTRY
jgi:hypothetical protein